MASGSHPAALTSWKKCARKDSRKTPKGKVFDGIFQDKFVHAFVSRNQKLPLQTFALESRRNTKSDASKLQQAKVPGAGHSHPYHFLTVAVRARDLRISLLGDYESGAWTPL
jgi:hypothetical protein